MSKSKVSIKMLIALVVVITSICVFNINKVNAVSSDLQNIADMLSKETIKANTSSDKFYEATNIQEQLNELVTKKNLENINVCMLLPLNRYTLWYGSDEDVKFSGDRIYYPVFEVSNGSESVETHIHIEYTDNNKYDSKTAENIKKIIDNDNAAELFIVDFEEYSSKTKSDEMWDDFISEYYKKILNDNSIEATLLSTQGGLNDLSFSKSEPTLNIYKNGVYYGTRTYKDGYGLVKITVPYETSDTNEAFINSALPKLKEYLKSTSLTMKYFDIKSGNKIYNVEDGEEYKGQVIIAKAPKKEEPKEEIKTVATIDKSTNIKLETTTEVVPSGTTLTAEKVTKGDNYNTVVKAVEKDVSKFVLYDISLMNNNTKIQPNGKVKVSIPVPTGYESNKIVVYRVADNGTKTKLNASVTDGYVVFETDHFSNYVIAEEKTNTPEPVKPNNDKRELDETPKTGEENKIITSSILLVSILSALGLAVVKKF